MTGHWIWVLCWIGLVAAGAVGALLVLRRASHRALGWALLIATVSVAVGGAILHRYWTDPTGLMLFVHIAAGLSVGWMLVSAVLRRHLPRIAGGFDALAAVEFFALACGMTAVLVLVHIAVFETAFRTFGYPLYAIRPIAVRPAGLLDIAAVAAATILGIRVVGERSLTTWLFWLCILASLWVSLLTPLVRGERHGQHFLYTPTDWPIPFMVLAAATVLVFTGAHHAQTVARRRRAWPGRLHDLLEPLPYWPGFLRSAGTVSMAVLFLGCLFVASLWTIPAAAATAVALFLIAHHHWNSNVAEAGMVLLTLALVALTMPGASDGDRGVVDYPAILRRALFGLAFCVFLWHWLAAFWRQQLEDGRAWTTTGRMIPVALRCGYMVTAIAVFLAFYLAGWPVAGVTADADGGAWSWIGGLTGIALLAAATTFAAANTGKPTLAWLSVFAVFAGVVFVHFRSFGTGAHLWATRHGPLLLALSAPLVAAMPRWLRLDRRSPYVEVLGGISLFVLPLSSLLLLLAAEYSSLAGRWVVPATLAAVGAWYAVCLLGRWRAA